MGDEGLEPHLDTTGKHPNSPQDGAHSGARGDADAILADQSDLRLLGINAAWPMLSEDARDAMTRLAGLRPDGLNDIDDLTPAIPHGERTSP